MEKEDLINPDGMLTEKGSGHLLALAQRSHACFALYHEQDNQMGMLVLTLAVSQFRKALEQSNTDTIFTSYKLLKEAIETAENSLKPKG